MKRLFLSALMMSSLLSAEVFPGNLNGKYDIELYFDKTPFHDEMELKTIAFNSMVVGTMHVPNDFDAEIENFEMDGNEFSFTILIPKNPSRPKDLTAKYFGRFYDENLEVFAGFATIVDDNTFMASFVGRRQKP